MRSTVSRIGEDAILEIPAGDTNFLEHKTHNIIDAGKRILSRVGLYKPIYCRYIVDEFVYVRISIVWGSKFSMHCEQWGKAVVYTVHV